MLESLGKIPKGVNIIIFIWAAIGLFLLFRDPKLRKEKLLYIGLAAIGFMAAWRVLFQVETSRYFSGLILPFTVLASYFLYNSGKKRHGLVRLALSGAIVITGIIILKMNVDSVTWNESGTAISEIFRTIDASRDGNYYFRAPWKDFRRIYYFSHLNGNIDGVYDPVKIITNYNNVYTDTVLNVESKEIAGDARIQDELRRKYRLIASLIEESNLKKKQLLYVLSNDNRCVPVPEDRIPPYRANLLDNGDMEELDSPEESREKLKTHMGQYAPSMTPEDPALTPRHAYFSVSDELTSPPEVNAESKGRIDGNHSVRIRHYQNKPVFLMFDKPFPNGEYEYSVLVRGEKGTRLRLVYEVCRDGGSEVHPIATFNIPDRRLFQITTRFSVQRLNPGEHFRAGVLVQKGDAVFDNFSLNEVGTASDAASGAD